MEEKWFTSGDVDGFFGLFFSGFPDLLLIVGLAPICGFPLSFVASHILPGAAISILAGNLFYAWQARRLASKEGRSDVTAIPFGVNAPTIFAYVFLIMGPVYARTHDANLAWHAGIFASLCSGMVQTAGAFCTDWLRSNAPRAALLSPLAGLALAYLCLGFIFGVFQAAGHCAAADARPLYPVWLASEAALSFARRHVRDRAGRGAGGGAALAAYLHRSPAGGARLATLSAPCSQIFSSLQPTGVLALSGHYCAARRAGYAGVADDSGER